MDLQYAPLADAAKEIRLLALKPATDTSAILEAELFHADLETAKYEALSYVWGVQNLGQGHIYLCYKKQTEGEVIMHEIGANLFEALLHLRSATEQRLLWIDALCIDQQNDTEKSHQVELMARIYMRSEQVVSWLGAGTAESDHAISVVTWVGEEFLKIYTEHVSHTWSSSYSHDSSHGWHGHCTWGWAWGPLFREWKAQNLGRFWNKTYMRLEFLIAQLEHQKVQDTWVEYQATARCVRFFGVKFIKNLRPLFKALLRHFAPAGQLFLGLKHLWTRTYWTRVWILQELFAKSQAKKPPTLMCGKSAASLVGLFIVTDVYLYLQAAVSDIQAQSKDFEDVWDAKNDLPYLYFWFRTFPRHIGASLIDLFESAALVRQEGGKICRATDPRDLVYALIPLTTNHIGLASDYSKDVDEVYTAASMAYLKAGHIDILRLAYRRKKGVSRRLPSWAVDWACSPSRLEYDTITDRKWIWDHEASAKKSIRFSRMRTDCLHLEGATVAMVLEVIHGKTSTRLRRAEIVGSLAFTLDSSSNECDRWRQLYDQIRSALPEFPEAKIHLRIVEAARIAYGLNDAVAGLVYSELLPTVLVQEPRSRLSRLFASRVHLAPKANPQTQQLMRNLLNFDMIVFSNGVCAFKRSHRIRVEVGDELALFRGCSASFIVRSQENCKEAVLVGPLPVPRINDSEIDSGMEKTFLLI